MPATPQDSDDEVRALARDALEILWEKYWASKKVVPAPSFDEHFQLRRAYEEAAVEFARLEGRLLRDALLSGGADVASFRRIRDGMAAAVQLRETIAAALQFIKLMVALV